MKNISHTEYACWAGRPVDETLLDLIDQLIDKINELEEAYPLHEPKMLDGSV